MELKYTKEILEPAVKNSTSWANVLRLLDVKWSGGSQMHIKRRSIALGIDYSHFTGQGWASGKQSNRRLAPSAILVKHDNFYKTKTANLKRALLESGVLYKCRICDIDSWQNQSIVLEIDHINGDNRDNRKENLRFLCPNCHSQTETYGYK